MKNIKKAAIAVIGAASLMMPAVAHAAQVQLIDVSQDASPVECFTNDGEFTQRGLTEGCDLSVDKQVSVNGGAYAEADTSAAAAQAQVGDSVTWQIVVSNNSDDGLTPYGKVTVHDILPSGATYDSYMASTGSYDQSDWTFSLNGALPATMVIASHASSTGLFKNTAALTAYDPCSDGCLGFGAYSDSNPDNDSNDAWMDPSGKPAVLAATTTLPNTGSGIAIQTIAASTLIVATLGILTFGRKRYSVSR